MMGGRRGGIRGADGSLLIIIYVLGLLLLFLKDHAIILSSLLCLIHWIPFLSKDTHRVAKHDAIFGLGVRSSNDDRAVSLSRSAW